ncbi:HCL563Wp [Eremothecium sinecaudum]|uniref:Ribosomal RNA-processing protein 43 n=1 Tax=Eremothecium sinecaudum TaxID=45286 RepID=A0A109UXY9_9SACH|nr:HCL563Wp [Eremothecium sinecaudum]AMD19588.1 HCL563Wp [Eremothecium sinecaudum]
MSTIMFPPQVLARISPDLYLQRHLSLGIRPCLRSFEEFRDIQISDENLSRYSASCKNMNSNNILGSNVLKAGKTVIITTITGGIIENTFASTGSGRTVSNGTKAEEENRTIYPLVEIHRGNSGMPTDEEMIIAQRLHDGILSSELIPKESLAVKTGLKTTDENGKSQVIYPEDGDAGAAFDNGILDSKMSRVWSYTLYAKVEVFSRDGPLAELCWNSLIYALQKVRLPRAYIDERASDLKIPVRTRGRSAAIRETYDILCDPTESIPLKLNTDKIAYASGFGVVELDPEAQIPEDDEEMDVERQDKVLLADLEGEAEETSINSRISVTTDQHGNFKNVTIIGGGLKLTKDLIRHSLDLAKERSKDLDSKVIS